jgi:UDP-N-acetyl-2-amino-2-deoxyglucuronate dehydrogenase
MRIDHQPSARGAQENVMNNQPEGTVNRFALIGAAGYIAPRHMRAIKDTGNELVAALDRSDSVGVIDSYFPDARFFTEFERFDRHLEKQRRAGGSKVDYVSICSPNYLHDAHIRFALRIDANAICEKPVVLNPWNVEALQEIEKEQGRNVNVILQLRLHPSIIALKERVDSEARDRKYNIDLTYITSRGRWYLVSWKGDVEKSGGIATNIGIHFFDMLEWIFGPVRYNIVHLGEPTRAAGLLELQKARVRWFLSIDKEDLPQPPEGGKPATYRSITLDGQEIEFSEGFKDLHTRSYEEILAGRGFGLEDAKPAVDIVSTIRRSQPTGPQGEYHPMLRKSR